MLIHEKLNQPSRVLSATTWGLLLGTPLLFALNVLTARWSGKALVPPVFLALSRWSLAFAILFPFVARRLWAARAEIRALRWNLILLGGMGMGVGVAPQYIGARFTSATNAAMILSFAPILAVIFESALKRQVPGWAAVVGIALATGGVAVILGRGDLRAVLNLSFGTGDLWILFSDVGWAAYTVLLMRLPLPRVDTASRMALLMAGAVLVLAPFSLLEAAGGQVPRLDGVTIASVAFLAVVPGILGFTGYACLIARAGETTAGMSNYLVPLYAAILAWPMLGELPRGFHLAGISLILAGVWLTAVSSRTAVSSALAETFEIAAAR
jgi:drug/metabolite transporter (DMT)-like permease